MKVFSSVAAALIALSLPACAFTPAAESQADPGHPAAAHGASTPLLRPMSLGGQHDHSQHDHSRHDHGQHDHSRHDHGQHDHGQHDHGGDS